MNVLVTGGLGFIGQWLVKELVGTGHEVTVVDHDKTKQFLPIVGISSRDVELQRTDFTDPTVTTDVIIGRYDHVFHLAALPSVPGSVYDPIGTNEENLSKSLKLVFACCGSHTPITIASTSAVYGLTNEDGTSFNVEHPCSPYAVQKLALEHYCNSLKQPYGLRYACLRYFNVFGPGQLPNGPYPNIICAWATNIFQNNPVLLYGDGTQSRDFVYVEDVASVTAATLELMEQKTKEFGFVADVGSGITISLNDVLSDLIHRYQDSRYRFEVTRLPARAGDVQSTLANSDGMDYLRRTVKTNIRKCNGYHGDVVDKTLQWYEHTNNRLAK